MSTATRYNPWEGVKLVSNWEQNNLYAKSYLKRHLWHVNVWFTDQNVMPRGTTKKFNFESIEMQK